MNAHYVQVDGNTEGPFTTQELINKVKSGALNMDHLYCSEGGAEWRQLRMLTPVLEGVCIPPKPGRRPPIEISMPIRLPDKPSALYTAQFLSVIGALWTLFYWLAYETAVQSSVNLDLMQRKQHGLMIGLVIVLLGGMSRIVAAIEAASAARGN